MVFTIDHQLCRNQLWMDWGEKADWNDFRAKMNRGCTSQWAADNKLRTECDQRNKINKKKRTQHIYATGTGTWLRQRRGATNEKETDWWFVDYRRFFFRLSCSPSFHWYYSMHIRPLSPWKRVYSQTANLLSQSYFIIEISFSTKSNFSVIFFCHTWLGKTIQR